jgi:hypothetical protein
MLGLGISGLNMRRLIGDENTPIPPLQVATGEMMWRRKYLPGNKFRVDIDLMRD